MIKRVKCFMSIITVVLVEFISVTHIINLFVNFVDSRLIFGPQTINKLPEILQKGFVKFPKSFIIVVTVDLVSTLQIINRLTKILKSIE